jgi:hypothetical protein
LGGSYVSSVDEGISSLIREVISFWAMWRHSKKADTCKSGSTFSRHGICWHLILHLPASRTGRNKCLLFKLLSHGIVIKAWAKTAWYYVSNPVNEKLGFARGQYVARSVHHVLPHASSWPSTHTEDVIISILQMRKLGQRG